MSFKHRRLIPVVIFLVSACAHASPEVRQFDLACSSAAFTFLGVTHPAPDVRYRVDLESRQFCQGDCQAVQQLAHVDDEWVYFDRSVPPNAAGELGYHRFHRINGRLEGHLKLDDGDAPFVDTKADCKIVPFSGFGK